MSNQEIEHKKSELIADLLATKTVMEEMWRYHPNNPDKKDIIQEYKVLEQMCSDIEKELSELEN